jgi:fatty-acyl-CoA synthase
VRSTSLEPNGGPDRGPCRGAIAHYKIPHCVKFVDGFPMTVTGKVQKHLMREQSVRVLGLQTTAAIEMA